jgi:hypothetical protein
MPISSIRSLLYLASFREQADGWGRERYFYPYSLVTLADDKSINAIT